ncbi:MAG TPA: hypothetical protein DEF27_01435 [Oscillatoriales bacterium UBA8482]|nr:MAG: hypothetical protein AUK43_12985 [Oscillatoriales cyanobacterium CG2_30_40_61]HBW56516.1 hypothetical protein [Oscillatoriales bacterium UBA8482]
MSSRKIRGQTTEGARAIAKKQGHAKSGEYVSAFDGIEATQINAEVLIQNILTHPKRQFMGDKVTDIYNELGQGVRFDKNTYAFIGFLEEFLATQ